MRIHLNWNKAKVDDWMNEGNDNQLDMEKNAVSIEKQHKNEELIKRLIKTEAAIKKAEADIKNSEKQIQQIKKSKTWKQTASIRNVLHASQDPQIMDLENEVESIRHELYAAKEIINTLKLESEKLDYNHLWRMAKEKKNEGTLIAFMEDVMERKQSYDENYNHLLKAAARLFMHEKKAYKQLVYPKLLSGLKVEDIPEFMIRSGLSEEEISLKPASSYRASLNMRMREHQLLGTLPEMLLDDKKVAYRFMNRLNIRTPEISERTYTLEEIPEKNGIAIKPNDGAGARGVYLVYNNNDIIDIKQSKTIANWQVLRKNMERDIESGRVSNNEWFFEELILEDKDKKIPARDIKFYCFYGKVALILEIVRYPEIKHCWWTASGERIGTGKYDESLFKGQGVTNAEIEMATAISAEIPSPFIRIDFLRSDEGLVFGEFTPKPGNYDEFDIPTDKWLGDYFIEAQGRLTNDLINGKEFIHYTNLKTNVYSQD